MEQHRLIDIEHDDILLRTFILFAQTAHEVLKYADAHLYRKAHLSLIRFVVLIALHRNGGTLTPSEITEWTQTERNNISTLIDRLKKGRLVRVKQNSLDRRSVNIILTDKGRQALSRAMPVAREIVNQVMLSISEGDAAPLEKSLRVLRQNAHPGLEHSRNETGK